MDRLRADWPELGPDPGDAAAAGRLAERLTQFMPGVLDDPAVAACVACFGGHSPYVSDLMLREAAWLPALFRDGPDAAVEAELASLDTLAGARAAVASALRRAKRRVALATAMADVGGLWVLEDVTRALSRLAERALTVAVAHLLPGRAPFVVIGMGKLGAGELNYSSDVDLLLLYTPAGDGDATHYARVAREVVTLMQSRDADGIVFRVDLRLRPDPQWTAPALPLGLALAHYESAGATWERAALSKARPVAGDLALGWSFLDAVAPFVWRRHLDFAALADMAGMKARIDRRQALLGARTLSAGRRLNGHDVKLGEGGIREIEFIAQTLQLVWGGREPGLRSRGTLEALRGLTSAGRMPAGDARSLGDAYRALRQVEHRLQMVADRQTHALPLDAGEFERFARFMGERDGAALSARLRSRLVTVQRVFGLMFAGREGFAGGSGGWEVEVGPDGFRRAAAPLIERWRAGGPRALRTERARAVFGEVLGAMLAALARQREPEAALARFANWLERLPAGVQVFSLLERNPGLVARIGDLLGASPVLADHLALVPAALEGLLASDEVDRRPGRTLRREIAGRREGGLEVAIETTRRFVRGEAFRLALAELEGRVDVDRAGVARTALAEAAIGVLLSRVQAAHVARHGRAPGGMVVVALGKAGSREMMGGSDLDLLMVYDGQESPRGLAASAYYGRLAQALVAAVTARGLDGSLYDVDMRLRPSGNQGPVAVSLASFQRYHRESAWTWERMALTRARAVAGPGWLRRAVADAIGVALDGAGPAVRADAVAMRVRLLRDKPAAGPWDVKMRAGGLMEVEFIAQALQLGPGRPRAVATRAALLALGRAGVLPPAEAGALAAADRLWRQVQSGLRLLVGRGVPAVLPEALRDMLGADVEDRLDRTAAMVRDAFERHLGRIEDVEGSGGRRG